MVLKVFLDVTLYLTVIQLRLSLDLDVVVTTWERLEELDMVDVEGEIATSLMVSLMVLPSLTSTWEEAQV